MVCKHILLDLTMENTWLADKTVLKQNGTQDFDISKQADFRAEMAECKIKQMPLNV